MQPWCDSDAIDQEVLSVVHKLIPTTDLSDTHEFLYEQGKLHVLHGPWIACGLNKSFAGQIQTLSVFEDNTLVRSTLSEPGLGRVLLVDGGASLRVALLGGNLGVLAQKQGWSGVLVYGAVRDSAELDQCAVGIRALGRSPRRSFRQGKGALGVPVAIQGVVVHPGHWLYADEDGVLVSHDNLLL